MENWVKYDEIEEGRNGYYVTYRPVFTGFDFATITIHVYDSTLVDKIQSIAEIELELWAQKYPVPNMVMISNETTNSWEAENIIGHNYLLGYIKDGEVISYWDEYPATEKPVFDLSKENLEIIYSGLKVTTYEQVIAKQAKEATARKVLLVFMTFWLCIIPALIAYFGWSSPFFSLLALIYSWYLAVRKGLSLWGKRKLSPKEIVKEKEELEKEHHHYHCKINPEGFLKLKCENFEKERLEKVQAKIESMRN